MPAEIAQPLESGRTDREDPPLSSGAVPAVVDPRPADLPVPWTMGVESVETRATGRAIASLRDIILGGQDGLVNVLGLVLGMAAATGDSRVVVTAALAAMLAESIAMAGVAYTATGAEQSWAKRARGRLTQAIEERREVRGELRRSRYRAQGHPTAAAELAEAVAADEAAAWAAELDLVERELAPIRATHPVRASLTVGLSTLIGSAIPLAPVVVLPLGVAVWVSLVVGIAVLFAVGVYRAHATEGGLLAAGLQMAIIGLVSALAGFVIGVLLRAPATA